MRSEPSAPRSCAALRRVWRNARSCRVWRANTPSADRHRRPRRPGATLGLTLQRAPGAGADGRHAPARRARRGDDLRGPRRGLQRFDPSGEGRSSRRPRAGPFTPCRDRESPRPREFRRAPARTPSPRRTGADRGILALPRRRAGADPRRSRRARPEEGDPQGTWRPTARSSSETTPRASVSAVRRLPDHHRRRGAPGAHRGGGDDRLRPDHRLPAGAKPGRGPLLASTPRTAVPWGFKASLAFHARDAATLHGHRAPRRWWLKVRDETAATASCFDDFAVGGDLQSPGSMLRFGDGLQTSKAI